MKYEKARAEIVTFDCLVEFMTGSLNGKHCDGYSWNGKYCRVYDQGDTCKDYRSNGGQAGYTCGTYKGSNETCVPFSDGTNTYPTSGLFPDYGPAFGCSDF